MLTWGVVTKVKKLQARFRCGACGRWLKLRATHPPADERGLVELACRCPCGAEYRGSLSLDWTRDGESA